MKRFQLTIVFVLFSALTIGAGAVAVSSLTASSAEKSIISLTSSQSERDAHFIATLVSQLLAEDAPLESLRPVLPGAPTELVPSPSFNSTTLLINASTVLEALDISNLAIYDTEGGRIWSSAIEGPMGERLTSETLSKTLANGTVSEIVKNVLIVPDTAGNADWNPSESDYTDLVVTFVPLVGEQSGVPVQVLGVSRPVPPGVAGLLTESRSTVMKTTLISLSGVFLILLAFVLAADVRIWKRNELALAFERKQQEFLGQQNQELSHTNESRSRFVSAISHEISGPLTALVAFVDIVLRNRTGNLTERQVEQLSGARRNGQQMARLVADLSHTARSEQGGLEIVVDEFEILPIFDEIAESRFHDLNTRQQVMKVELDPTLAGMTADRGRMIQVISNLLSNASKYSPNGSTVRLIARGDGQSLHVEVIDQGIGISEEDQDHIFEMFWRADNPETQNVPGTGIGLVIAKEIIEGHGGEIRLSSVSGEGTTVIFDVPLKSANSNNGGPGERLEAEEFGARAA